MNYFSRSDTSKLKAQSLKEIKQKFPAIKEVKNSDTTVLELLFQSSRQFFTLGIYLDNQYPTSRPVLQVSQPVFFHPWLDHHRRVVGSPKLNNWTKNSVLGDVVQECLSQFQQASQAPIAQPPPYLSTNASLNAQSHIIPANNGVTLNNGTASSQPFTYVNTARGIIITSGLGGPSSSINSLTNCNASRPAIPPVRSKFTELDTLTFDELKNLQSNPDGMQALLAGTPEVGDMMKQREDIRIANTSLAIDNIRAHESYEVICSEVIGLQRVYENEIISHQSKLIELEKKYKTEDLRKQLEERKQVLDQQSQDCVRKLAVGSMDLASFINMHKELRTRFYCLEEKLKHCTG